jgi:gamma-carbonic anhydrase
MTIQERLELFLSTEPQLAENAFIAAGATVIGDVRLGARSSVWYGCVLRGDINFIQIGEATNVQDGTVIHLADDFPVIIGDYVTIGHAAVVHACVVEDECLIGMNSTILDGAVIGARSIVAAGSLVPQGMQVPPGSLVAGVPAKVKRALGEEEQAFLRSWAEKYVAVAAAHDARAG